MSPAPRQHTPGPWQINHCTHAVISPDGFDIALLRASDFDSEANARLIASAPDLLNLLTAADRLEELSGDNLAVYARTYAALARAAIARATGGNAS